MRLKRRSRQRWRPRRRWRLKASEETIAVEKSIMAMDGVRGFYVSGKMNLSKKQGEVLKAMFVNAFSRSKEELERDMRVAMDDILD